MCRHRPDLTSVEHLERIKGFDERVFPWDISSRSLYVDLGRIQTAAGIHMPCIDDRKHECSDACHQYSFHDFRRAFATNNEAVLSPKELQSLMRHKSRATTDRYIILARNLKRSADNLFVPDVLKKDAI